MDFSTIMEQIAILYRRLWLQVIGAITPSSSVFWVIGWITRVINNAMEKRGWTPPSALFWGLLVSVGTRKILLLLSVARYVCIETTYCHFQCACFAHRVPSTHRSLGAFASGVMLLVFQAI